MESGAAGLLRAHQRLFIMLDILHKGSGTTVSVSDEELLSAVGEIGAAEGHFPVPEGAACLPALKRLLQQGAVKHDDRVVCLAYAARANVIRAAFTHYCKMRDNDEVARG